MRRLLPLGFALTVLACGGGGSDDVAPDAGSGAPATARTSTTVDRAAALATPAGLRLATDPAVLFSKDADLTGGPPRFNVIVRTNHPLAPAESEAAVRADLTVNGIGDPAPVTRVGPVSQRCYALMIEGGSPETDEVADGTPVTVTLIVLTTPRRRLTGRVPAQEVSGAALSDDSGLPAQRYLRQAGCRR